VRGLTGIKRSANREEGVTLVIVTLCLVALFGMLVLVVDVGGLLLNRREMVNASDAAALAAAKSCILPATKDPLLPEEAADKYAADNSSKAKVALPGNVLQISGPCKPSKSKTGFVTVQYTADQHLFFAPVLGAGNTGGVTTQATAVWGPPKAVNPLPLVVYANAFNSCNLDHEADPNASCYIWEDNSNTAGAQSGFGYLDLRTDNPAQYGWDSNKGATCPNTGLIKDWVANYPSSDIGDLPINYEDPTYVCRLDGGASSVFGNDVKKDGPIYDLIDPNPQLNDDEHIIFFPINRCDSPPFGQVDKNGNAVACGLTPNQYDIIGFVALRLIAVYTPNEAGSTTTSCGSFPQDFQNSTLDIDLDASSSSCVPYDNLVNVQLKKGGSCCTLNIEYTYDPVTHVIHWQGGKVDGVRVTWDAFHNGACGTPPAGNNAGHCMVVKVVDVTIGGSDPTNDQGVNGNIRAYRLCEPAVPGSCLPFTVPAPP
jgi:Flp pilus assembly protein TadG